MYMTARVPLAAEAAWKTTPTVVMMPVPIKQYRRPYFSVNHEVKKQDRKQPACRVDTMFWSWVVLAPDDR
jgi:hypothetical protein